MRPSGAEWCTSLYEQQCRVYIQYFEHAMSSPRCTCLDALRPCSNRNLKIILTLSFKSILGSE